MLPEIGRLAEASGASGVYVADHVVLGDDVTDYPYGRFHHEPGAPFMEPFAQLAALAVATSRITLGTHVLLAALRPTLLLAKTAATVDRLSRGRLELGVGVGWHRYEFDSMGIPFDERGSRLDHTVAGCRELWRSSPATFRSATVSSTRVYCEPRPTRAGGPPVLFAGAMSPRNRRRIVAMGDGWVAPGVTNAREVAEGVARLRAALSSAGRDPAVKVRAAMPIVRDGRGGPQLEATLAQVRDFADAGATDVVIPVAAFVSRADDLERWFKHLDRAWGRAGP